MANFKRTNKLPMVTILVNRGDQILPTGSFTTATTALNLQPYQFGVLSWDFNGVRTLGNYILPGDDSSEVRAIKVVAGTPASTATQTADLWEVGDKAYLESGIIYPDKIHSVAVLKARYPKLGAQAGSNFATPADDTEYKGYVRLLSTRNDVEYGDNDEFIGFTVPATDWTTAGITNVKDYVLTSIVSQINGYSRLVAGGTKGNKNVVAFGIKVAGGTGTTLGTIAVGTSIPFETINGTTSSAVADIPMIRALAEAVNSNAQLTTTSSIVNISMATAGDAANVDAIIVLGLQEPTAAVYDNIEQVQTRVELNLGGGFLTDATTATVTDVFPDEGTNQGTKWSIVSRDRYLLSVHTMQNHPHGDWFAEGLDYIQTGTKLYTSYIIDHYGDENILNMQIASPKKLVMLFPCEKASSFTVTVANVVTRLAASQTPIPMVTSNDAGTGTASVNTVAGVNASLDFWLEKARLDYGFDLVGEAVAGTYLS